MSKVIVKLKKKGVRELMQSQELLNECKRLADAGRARCGEGYIVTTYVGKTRANASIYAETEEAKEDNYKNKTIMRSLR